MIQLTEKQQIEQLLIDISGYLKYVDVPKQEYAALLTYLTLSKQNESPLKMCEFHEYTPEGARSLAEFYAKVKKVVRGSVFENLTFSETSEDTINIKNLSKYFLKVKERNLAKTIDFPLYEASYNVKGDKRKKLIHYLTHPDWSITLREPHDLSKSIEIIMDNHTVDQKNLIFVDREYLDVIGNFFIHMGKHITKNENEGE